jgi:peptidoglycan/xylan/chitin deacetylase (PgdA/CDA1 family)
MVVLALLAFAGTIALSAPGANAPGSSVAGAGGIGSLTNESAAVQGRLFATYYVPKQCKARDPGTPVFHGPEDQPRVALTFDDGPVPNTTNFLNVLDEKNVKATFFVIGRYIPGNEAILQREVAEGHYVENHTLNHANVSDGGELAKAEIDPTTRMITEATGMRPCAFRPPYGAYKPPLETFLRRADLDLIRWDIDTGDSGGATAESILANVKANLHPGAIILMHDGVANSAATLSVLPQIIDFIRRKGYEMVTIPELLGLRTDEPRGEPTPVRPPPDLETPEVDDQQRAAGDSGSP